ncbi:hypothetical protein HPB50_008922 [Hyalomma asiaticum]|uniref:Uncharacterized protein n=1 Tax=Hyalomma asiaticum TaxID=266040 RepID=A0ACB7THG3_HYAAI|nr:hypothetical protein HPB50_008922 [Hyalomma asiaticum]
MAYAYQILSSSTSPQVLPKESCPPPTNQRVNSGYLKCVTCQKEFSSEQDFAAHQRRHTGARPFQCCRYYVVPTSLHRALSSSD